jgi:hypothetical protein
MDSFAEQDLMEQRFETLRENLLEIAAQVQRRAPGCNLIFVDYLTVLPPDAATPTGVLPADVAEWAGAWPAGFSRSRRPRRNRAEASSCQRQRRASITTHGPPRHGHGDSISPCAKERRTIPTRLAWPPSRTWSPALSSRHPTDPVRSSALFSGDAQIGLIWTPRWFRPVALAGQCRNMVTLSGSKACNGRRPRERIGDERSEPDPRPPAHRHAPSGCPGWCCRHRFLRPGVRSRGTR